MLHMPITSVTLYASYLQDVVGVAKSAPFFEDVSHALQQSNNTGE